GVTFHDGSEFNAEVVEANIDRLKDIARASPRVFILDMISEVNVIDDYTVEIITEYPFSPLLGNLFHAAGKRISKALMVEGYKNANDEAESNIFLVGHNELLEDRGS